MEQENLLEQDIFMEHLNWLLKKGHLNLLWKEGAFKFTVERGWYYILKALHCRFILMLFGIKSKFLKIYKCIIYFPIRNPLWIYVCCLQHLSTFVAEVCDSDLRIEVATRKLFCISHLQQIDLNISSKKQYV